MEVITSQRPKPDAPPAERILVLGAGQAGFQLAASLREGGFAGEVTLVGAEAGLPYNRPPLSKSFLLDDQPAQSLLLRPGAFYADRRITLRLGQRAAALDRAARRVRLGSGEVLPYDHLVLATGARNRALPVPGADLPGVHALRDATEAAALRGAMARARRMVVVGAGFIGLECAGIARARGLEVTVLEAGARPMARTVSAATAEAFRQVHAAAGIRFAFDAAVTRILAAEGRAAAVETADGTVHPADLVLVAVGVRPNAELAAAAGLPVQGGVLVDATLRTADPDISAIGDCAAYPVGGGALCLESVQAAVDGARCVAARLLGRPAPYAALPWFWSDQGAAKLQIAGLGLGHDAVVMRGAPGPGGFSAFLYRGGRLCAVESVGRPADHMQARRILAAGLGLSPELAADASHSLRQVQAA
jgi:3-phenylpropionate/trans-cinnamate dioxygenase ferredoxin reductase subunit